jgi:hypothetical protein
MSASFSADGGRVVTASSDQTVRLWDAVSGQEITRITLDAGMRSPRIKGDVASRFWPPPAIVEEEDPGEQRQQQRAACHNKAHVRAT